MLGASDMAFGNGFDNDDEVMSEINMTPLVDVMLVLLIIFIIAMPLLNHAVEIDLPHADNQPLELTPDVVTLSVSANGDIHWNTQLIDEDDLTTRLQASAQKQPQPEVHLRGDRQVDYELVMEVMAAVQRAGILKLGFVTSPDG